MSKKFIIIHLDEYGVDSVCAFSSRADAIDYVLYYGEESCELDNMSDVAEALRLDSPALLLEALELPCIVYIEFDECDNFEEIGYDFVRDVRGCASKLKDKVEKWRLLK